MKARGAQAAPERGTFPAAGGPFGVQPGQPWLERALANAEDVLARAPHDAADDLTAAARAPQDRLDGDALGGARLHRRIRLLAAEETLVLDALGRCQQRGRDFVLRQRLADVAEARPDGVDEGPAGMLRGVRGRICGHGPRRIRAGATGRRPARRPEARG